MIYETCLTAMFILTETTIIFFRLASQHLDGIVHGLCFPASTFLQSGVYKELIDTTRHQMTQYNTIRYDAIIKIRHGKLVNLLPLH